MPSATTIAASQRAAAPALTRTASRTRWAAPKMIAGIGAILTLAAVAAVVTTGAPPSQTITVAPIASAYSTTPSLNSADLPAIAPVSTAPALVSAPAPAPALVAAPVPAQRQCSLPLRKFYVSGNGTVRVRDGNYVSPPLILDTYPQEVVFPATRPTTGVSPPETIVVEGQARLVVMTSDLPGFRQVFNGLRGPASLKIQWAPLRNC